MRAKDNMRTAAEVLVDQLRIHGVQHVFCVPGESYLAVLDAFHDSDLNVTVCRQEGGACMMAEAVGKVTGRPGVCFVTRGPGATNASPRHPHRAPGFDAARHVRRPGRARHARARGVSGTRLPRRVRLDDQMGDRDRRSGARAGDRVAGVLHRGQWPARSGRRRDPRGHAGRARCGARRAAVCAGRDLAGTGRNGEVRGDARRRARADHAAWRQPLVAGGVRRHRPLRAEIFAAGRHHVPPRLICSINCIPCYAGDLGIGPNPKLLERIKSADLVVMVGGRLGELPSQSYTLFDIPGPQMPFVHVHPGAEELGRVYSPHLAINATPTAFAAALENLAAASDASARPGEGRACRLSGMDREADRAAGRSQFRRGDGVAARQSPADAILCNGAGNYASWVHRFFRFRRFGQHVAPASGSMGYGVPAAVAMKRLYPDRHGGLPCRRRRLSDERPGIRHRRAIRRCRSSPSSSTTACTAPSACIRSANIPAASRRPNCAIRILPAYARAFGGFGVSVERTEDFPAAFKQAQASGKPAIIRLEIDPEAITPTTTIAKIRAKSLADKSR